MFDAERFAAGDDRYVEDVIREHSPMVLMVCQAYARDYDHAQDLYQEIWRTVWTKAKSFRGDGSFRAWLHRVATNVCRTDARTRKKALEVRDAMANEPNTWSQVDPMHATHLRELQRAILRALPQLTPGERQALTLRVLEGRRPDEVARIMNITPATVRSHVRHALNHLREMMEDPEHDLSRYRALP
jgi:RNA polymerase sigma-70 factor (ECF subfamily)